MDATDTTVRPFHVPFLAFKLCSATFRSFSLAPEPSAIDLSPSSGNTKVRAARNSGFRRMGALTSFLPSRLFLSFFLRRLSMVNHRGGLQCGRSHKSVRLIKIDLETEDGPLKTAHNTNTCPNSRTLFFVSVSGTHRWKLFRITTPEREGTRSWRFFSFLPGVLDDGPLSSHAALPQQTRRSRAVAGNR